MGRVLRSIVVPLDDSAFSLHALPLAVGLAARAGAALHLLHVSSRPVSPAAAQLVAQSAAEMDHRLQDLADQIRERWKVEASTAIRRGRAAEAIARYAREIRADLIVLTTHGRGGLSRLLLGSVAAALVRIADRPLLAVRPARGAPNLRRVPLFRRILAPLDGSHLAELSLNVATTVAQLCNAPVTLLRVITPHRAIARPAPVTRLDRADLARQRRAADTYLRGVAARLRRKGVPVTTRVVAGSDPARAIINSAGAQRAGLIALATHARGTMGRILQGSVCDQVLRSATLPAVLLTRPRGDGVKNLAHSRTRPPRELRTERDSPRRGGVKVALTP